MRHGPAPAQPIAERVPPIARAAEPTGPAEAPGDVPARDLRGASWWVVEHVLAGDLATPKAAVVVSALRLLASLGPEPRDEAEVLREVELRGLIMHGMLPRDEAEWELARERFSADALDHIQEAWRQRRERGELLPSELGVPFDETVT